MRSLRMLLISVFCSSAASAFGAEPDANSPPKLPPAAQGTIDFDKDIRPLLQQNCLKCHNADKQKGGLRLDQADVALAGGNSGKVIVRGKAVESRLLLVVAGLDPDIQMPPEGPRLPAGDIGKLRAWIDQGANWPADAAGAGNKTKSTHWAFQPITVPPLPAVQNPGWVRNGIDRFILARLEKEGIKPSAEADKVTLIRRVSLDLLGLPPTREEVDAFLKDPSTDAYERLVERLLASPHYGERWGRHWLDAARYADSDGYEKDTGRPWAWRYRDWVIDALNRDLPFDRFTIEQLAGDLLPNATLQQKMATGFHRNTLTNKEGGVDQEEFRIAAVKDRVETTTKVWLGITLGCAQCHDHKYDPFTQREFYQFAAFFNSDREDDIAAALPGEEEALKPKRDAWAKKKAELAKGLEEYKRQLPELQAKWESALTPEETTKLPATVAEALKVESEKRSSAQKKLIADHFAKSDKKLAKLTKALADHEKAAPSVSKAPTLQRGPERKTHVMIRGDFLRPGVEVRPNTPKVLNALAPAAEEGAPTRLDLANWIVDPANPLTRRVLVNWIWQKYFGRGLVATLEDFGTQGERPSHPELLDWLATQLVQEKWSLKALHRLIVTSATYRQSSKARPELGERDPLNILLARQNRMRLEAEGLRDRALSVSGLLVEKVGGPSVRPPQPPGISELTYANSAKWVESTGPDRYRRGLYTWFQRTSPYPMLMTFDSPDGVVCTVRRERSNTPLQALTLMNDVVFVECARALGQQLAAHHGDVAERAVRAFKQCMGREPTPFEKDRLTQLFTELRDLATQNATQAPKLLGKQPPDGDPIEAAAWVAFARALLNLDEFVTRE
jgi:Protein of unknown function (DUF1553)/Protein of unknown function (DUF1549)/Planctomycete cytochrome C